MAVNREAIFAALFTRLQSITGLAYTSRIWRGESELGAITEQPALVLVKGDERMVSQPRGLPPRWELSAVVILVARVTEADPSIAPSTILNGLLTQLEEKLQRSPTEAAGASPIYANNPDLMYGTTLGGLCTSVQFAGDITIDEGAVSLQGLAIAPLTIIVAG